MLLKVLCVVVFVGGTVVLVMKPPTPLPRGSLTSVGATAADDEAPPVPPLPEAIEGVPATRPKTHTVISGDTCVDIAKAYCDEAQWPQFQRHNGIRVVIRNGRQQCVLRPGAVYALPPEWNDDSCNAPVAEGATR
jgi:nucleoid-associated protein YgaU